MQKEDGDREKGLSRRIGGPEGDRAIGDGERGAKEKDQEEKGEIRKGKGGLIEMGRGTKQKRYGEGHGAERKVRDQAKGVGEWRGRGGRGMVGGWEKGSRREWGMQRKGGEQRKD